MDQPGWRKTCQREQHYVKNLPQELVSGGRARIDRVVRSWQTKPRPLVCVPIDVNVPETHTH